MQTRTSPPAIVSLADRPPFDLRYRRDFLGRRIFRDAIRTVMRVTILLAGDALAVAASLALSVGIVAQPGGGGGKVAAILPLALTLVLAGQAAFSTYAAGWPRTSYGRIVAGTLGACAILAALGVVYSQFALSLPEIAAFAIAITVLLCTGRAIADLGSRGGYRRGIGRKATLVIGARDEAWEVLERVQRSGQRDIHVVGHLAPRIEEDPTALGGLDRLGEVIERLDVENVIISGGMDPERFRAVVRESFLHGAAVSVVPATLNELSCRISSRTIANWPLLELRVPQLHLLQLGFKRILDFVGAVIGILILAPVFAILALAIKLDSPGSVFFRQRRLGVGGRTFGLYKFRSMRGDAEEVLKANSILYHKYIRNGYKLPPDEDPRISRLGRFLRKSSLDELPQLFNVVRGEMSLVGPRPIVPPEIEEYGPLAADFLSVKPGMTGYWQICGRSDVTYPERVDVEMFYVRNWSLALDLKILGLTLPAVLRQKGAH